MRSQCASSRRPLPGLLLAGLLLAGLITMLSLVGTPSADASPGVADRQPSGPAAAFGPVLHDDATVHRSTGSVAPPQLPQLPVTAVADPHRAPSPQVVGTGTGPVLATQPGADAISTCLGRAPPPAAR